MQQGFRYGLVNGMEVWLETTALAGHLISLVNHAHEGARRLHATASQVKSVVDIQVYDDDLELVWVLQPNGRTRKVRWSI
jgi:hypothetical protein